MLKQGHRFRPTLALGPIRYTLYKARLGLSELFEPLLEFLPDARDSEETCWVYPL